MKYRPTTSANPAVRRSPIKPRAGVAKYALVCSTAMALLAGQASAEGQFLYTQTNDHQPGMNAVMAYERGPDGILSPHVDGPFLTQGTGIDNNTNGKLGPNDNDTPIIASADDKRLFAVNGNSNTIAVFDVLDDGALVHVPGSPFAAMGIGPVSLSLSGDILIVANRNEDPAQLDELRGEAHSSYASFRVGPDGGLNFISRVENQDGHKATQVLVAAATPGIVFGNDFQVDADFDGDGPVSRLFSNDASVQGRLRSFYVTPEGDLSEADIEALTETADPAPDVPTLPLGIWDHPTKNLLYVGLVTRNQLGVYSYDDSGDLSFVSAVPNSGQDICWLRVNRAGTRLYAVNNLPREGTGDTTSTITVFDISGANAENPVELSRSEIPLPAGTFVNNRTAEQPGSTAFQLTLDPSEEYLYVVNQRIDQTAANTDPAGNVIHSFRIDADGSVVAVAARDLLQDGVNHRARPQGLVAIDIN